MTTGIVDHQWAMYLVPDGMGPAGVYESKIYTVSLIVYTYFSKEHKVQMFDNIALIIE